MRLFGNLFVYIWQGRGNNSNTYLIKDVLRGDRPHVLIDPGHVRNEIREMCFENLLSMMRRDNINPEDIGLIINTHHHPDHTEANGPLLEITRRKGKRGKIEEALIAIHEDEPPIDPEPHFYLTEGELILGKENKLRLRIIHTPGHTPGSISIYIEELRTLITGDTVFAGAIGRVDLPGGDRRKMKESIEKLSQIDAECLLPGHSTERGNIIMGREAVKRNFSLIKMAFFPFL